MTAWKLIHSDGVCAIPVGGWWCVLMGEADYVLWAMVQLHFGIGTACLPAVRLFVEWVCRSSKHQLLTDEAGYWEDQVIKSGIGEGSSVA